MKLIGYIALDADGEPYRRRRSSYSWEVGLTHPPRLYSTMKRAEAYSPVRRGVPVYAGEVYSE
jgi:hypothetical protein